MWEAPRCRLHAVARWGARGTHTQLCTPLPATGIHLQREFCLREYKRQRLQMQGKMDVKFGYCAMLSRGGIEMGTFKNGLETPGRA